MIERSLERLLQFAHAGNDAGIDQRIEISEPFGFLLQVIEEAQSLHVFLGQRGNVGLSENLKQRDLERRKRKRAVKAVTAALPLAGHARMTIKKGRDQVGLVAMDFARIFGASKIAEHRLGDFWIGIGRKGPAQHGRSNSEI